MKILIIADPLESVNAVSDTTLYLGRAAIRRGHQVFWAIPDSVRLVRTEVQFDAATLVVSEKNGHSAGARVRVSVSEADAVWIRKDPPFDAAYVRLCWLLALMESRTWFLNRPSLLLRYHEKLVPAEAVAQGFLAPNEIIDNFYHASEELRQQLRESNNPEAVAKPFFGYGGRDIRRVPAEDLPKEATLDTLMQPFHPEVQEQGDHRLFYLGGKFVGHVARMPKPGGFVSNFAQGGTGESRALSGAQMKVVEKLGSFLKATGIDLAGADLIGTHISEVNITSPTGLVAMQKLDGTSYGDLVMEFVEDQSSSD